MSLLWIADASPGVATWCAVFFRDSWCALKSPFIFTTSKTWSCSRPFSTLHPTPQVREEIVKESASVRCDKLWILVNTQFISLLLPKERRFNCKNSVGHTNTTLTPYFYVISFLHYRSLCSFYQPFQLIRGVPWQCHHWGDHSVRCQ